jgi:hypothetical protein
MDTDIVVNLELASGLFHRFGTVVFGSDYQVHLSYFLKSARHLKSARTIAGGFFVR